MSITKVALKRARFTLAASVALMIAGLGMLFGFPATEEPSVPFRAATIEAYLPGASSERVEQLLAKPLEERIRELPEVEHIETTVRPGSAFITVLLHDATPPERLAAVWQRLRAKAADASSQMPEEALGPIVNDEYGRVSVMTLALTGSPYSAGQLRDWARSLQNRLQAIPGVASVSLHGVQEERVYVELSPKELAAAGLNFDSVAAALASRNAIAPAGELDAGGRLLALEPTGLAVDVARLAQFQIPLPNGGSVSLSSLGDIAQQPQDPPTVAALYNGEPAVVVGISMQPGLNISSFSDAVNRKLETLRSELPVGMELSLIADQAKVVNKDLFKVGQIFLETIVIVMAVVILFLGWRAGMVTGLIVPMTVLGTLAVMRVLGIELHQVSIAAIIISLGIFVDNGIVVVEDYQRRVSEGETREAAAVSAGQSMSGPLLISSVAIILAFAPLVAGTSETAEYMRSLGVVMAITLLLSLLIALTLTALLAKMFVPGESHDEGHTDFIGRVRSWYERLVRGIVARPRAVTAAMVGLLVASAALSTQVPSELLSPSERKQLQIPIELSPGASSRATYETAQALSARLSDPEHYPEVQGVVVYVGDGGPRFILGLNPPLPAPHRAYAVVNLDRKSDLDGTAARMEEDLRTAFPEAQIVPKRFSLGASEAGVTVFRLSGPDRAVLEAGAAALSRDLRAVPGMVDIRDDAETRINRLVVDIDQAKAQAAGISTLDVTRSLEVSYAGTTATVLPQAEILVPVILRAPAEDRLTPERLATMPIFGAERVVALGTIADVRVADQPSVLLRRNQNPVVTVTARHPDMTAQAIADRMAGSIAALNLPAGHHLELGGEIEETMEANAGLEAYLPAALLGMAALFLWQFGSLRKTAIIMASIPFVLIGATVGLLSTGQPMSYTATLGLLALAGIIVNNAVLLLERAQEETNAGHPPIEAIARAASIRLRPIVMTKLTCILGLVPLFVFGGELWRPMAAAMIGGLALGTLITLVLIPALYSLLFAQARRAPKSQPNHSETMA